MVQSLALVGGALSACADAPMGADGSTVRDASDTSVSNNDVPTLEDRVVIRETAVVDVVEVDVVTPGDQGVVMDVPNRADVVQSDVVQADGSQCPAAPPMNMSACSIANLACTYSDPSMLTQCSCMNGQWQCFTAVPGPLPPPELV